MSDKCIPADKTSIESAGAHLDDGRINLLKCEKVSEDIK